MGLWWKEGSKVVYASFSITPCHHRRYGGGEGIINGDRYELNSLSFGPTGTINDDPHE